LVDALSLAEPAPGDASGERPILGSPVPNVDALDAEELTRIIHEEWEATR
jgi:hypothetical protein